MKRDKREEEVHIILVVDIKLNSTISKGRRCICTSPGILDQSENVAQSLHFFVAKSSKF